MLFSTLVAQHQQHLRAARRSPKTLAWYSQQLAVFSTWQAARGLADTIPSDLDLDEYLADQHALGLSPRTVHARYRALRAVLSWAEKRKRLHPDQNPIRLVEAPRMPRDRRPSATPEQMKILQASIGSIDWIAQRDQLILLLLYYCGLRVGELCALQVADIDLAHAEVVVRQGKGEKARNVPAPEELRSAVVSYLYARPAHEAVLLIKSDGWQSGGGALAPEGIRQMLIRRCRRAGLPPLHPHMFRHAYAMWLLNSGARLETVSAAMGHSTTAVTQQVYAYTLTSTVRREYDAALERHRTLNGLSKIIRSSEENLPPDRSDHPVISNR